MTPEQKLFLGLLFIPAYLLQDSIIIRVFQFILLIIIYLLNGGKFKILPNIMLFSGIIFAYILIPAGKVIFLVGKFPVTQGSINSGLTRALMLIGLIYISRLTVSSKLKLKGQMGNMFGRVFYYFEAITEWKGSFPIRKIYKNGYIDILVKYIDNILITFENKNYPNYKVDRKENLSLFLLFVIILLILASYILLLPLFKII